MPIEEKLSAIIPQAPEERPKETTLDLVRDVFGEDEEKHPSIRQLGKAQRGDIVRVQGQKCIVVERTASTRQGREAEGITVLREIDGEIYTCSYFVEDLEGRAR